MGLYVCPLCCQQEFSSIVALREHLVYYIYRPLICVICSATVGGIYELMRHLKSHILKDKNSEEIGNFSHSHNYYLENETENFQPENCSSKKDEGTRNNLAHFSSCDANESMIRAFLCDECGVKIIGKDQYFKHIQQHSKESTVGENYKVKTRPNFGDDKVKEVSDLYMYKESPANLERENKSLSLSNDKHFHQEMYCKDNSLPDNNDINYSHNVSLYKINTSNNSNSELHNVMKVSNTANSKLCDIRKLSNSKLHNVRKHCNLSFLKENVGSHLVTQNEWKSETNSCTIESQFSMSKATAGPIATTPPYIHKKFDHDLERKVEGESNKSDVQCYIQNFQSLLVNKLNQAFENNEENESTIINDELNSDNSENTNPVTKGAYVNETSKLPLKYNCKFCSKSFVWKQSRETHENNRTCISIHKCKFCKKNFFKLYLLLRHQEEQHSSYTYACNICGKRFKSRRFLMNHKGIHEKKRLFSCLQCSHSCYTASGLRTHIYEAHKKIVRENKCDLCGQTFKKKYGLQRHTDRKHNKGTLSCKYCDKAFPCTEDLSQHLNIHVDYESLICIICNTSFSSSSSLKRHSATHKNAQSSFKCELCSCSYTRKDSLINHMKVHNEQWKFVCKCGKQFMKKSHLKYHAVKHAKPKFQCSTCHNIYKFKTSLKKHKCKTKTSEKANVLKT